MSQSAENQSAIIENENNYNIAMESQAAEGESSRVGVHLEGVPTADSEPGTPTQDEVEQRPDIEEALGSDTRAGDFASNKETGEDFTAGAGETDLKYGEETGLIPPAGEPTESQDELRPQSPAEGQGQEEGAETMEVDPPQLDGSAHIQGQENVSSEPEGTDCVQDDNSDQQYLGEGKESEPVSSQAEPESYEAEADSHSALAPNSEVEEDRGGIAAEDVDMEGQEFQQDDALDEDQNIPMEGAKGLQGDSEAPEEDQSLAVGGEEGQQGESGMLQDDQNLDMGEGAEEQWGEGVSSHKDQNLTVKETERQEMESENAPVEGVDHGESGTAGEGQTLAMEEGAEGNQDESGIPEEDHNPPMEETERQPADSGELEDQNLPLEDTGQWGEPEQDQNLPNEDTEHLGEPEQDQNLPTEDTEHLGEPEQDQNLPTEDTEHLGEPEQDQNLPAEGTEQLGEQEQDQNLPVEDTEQLGEPEQDQNLPVEDTKQLGEPDETVVMEEGEGQECESGKDHEIQNLPVGDSAEQEDVDNVPDIEENLAWREADQLAESERTEGDQNVAGGKTEAGQQEQDDAIDEERLLAEDNSQDEQQADDQSQNVHSESQRNEDAAEASECQPDSSVTGDTKASDEMSDHDAGIKEETSTNEDENITGVDSIRETKDTHLQSEKVNGNGEAGDNLPTIGDTEATEMDHETTEASVSNTTNLESKSSNGVDKLVEDTEQALDPEADRASDVTIVEGRDADDEPMLQVTNIKSGADAEDRHDEKQDSVGDVKPDEASLDTGITSEAADKVSESAGESEMADAQTDAAETEKMDIEQKRAIDEKKSADDDEDDDDDVVVLENEADSLRKNDTEKEVLNSNNDMGIQIESVSGGANDVHGTSDYADIKQENTGQKSNQTSAAAPKADKSGAPPVKKSRTQTCIVCKKIGKCKYNIVRNGDIKHLCDEACFKRFRANPTVFLKGSGSSGSASAAEKKSGDAKASGGATATQGLGKPPSSVPGYKTCTVCLLMNLNSQGHFCIWKGLDFCGEGCLGKFQSGISSSCALCSTFIPLASRPTHCLRLGSQMRPFCSNRCYADFKLRLRLCTQCQKDASSASDAFFSAPVGSDGSFKDFCSQVCMKKFEELLNTDVEIIRVEAGKPRSVNKCSVCQKKEIVKHIIKYKGTIHNLCSDSCISAFQYANKLDMKTCEFCSTLCTSRESSLHTVQFEGHQKQFCSDKCVTKFRFDNRKVSPCSWCGTQRDNFDMIERLDSASKYQLFCSLNCLSLYRVNLQAKSNQPVTCDQCSKRAPAQYHLTMSDASVRNFCSYNCVMTFQAQFSKGPTSAEPPTPAASAAPAPVPQPSAAKQPNTRGRPRRAGRPQAPSFPIISNVISLAPQGGQQVNIKNSTGMPVVVSGATQAVKTSSTASQGPVQQQIIIQPPPPKPVKNKSILCKPFTQTKATSCRPHTQSKECQTDEVPEKPVVVPVPVPIYMPAPMSLYSAPAPTPIFLPIPIPVPIFIPTTRKSANGILKQIKEIREKTPSDPLEAELLMMAAAVSADGKNSSDSESEEEMLPEVTRPRKRMLPADDDDDADVMPLTTPSKEEEGGEEDMISMALRMAEEMSGPIADLESAVEAVPVSTEPPPQPPRPITPDAMGHEEEMIRNRRGGGGKRGGTARRGGATARPPKRPRLQLPQPEAVPMRQEPPPPPPPPADANYHLKFTYGVNAWRHWVLFKNNQIERNMKPGCGRVKLFKTDIMQCTADELNFSLCLFVKEVRKPNGDEYSADSIYYLCLGIQQYLYENGRIDNIFTDFYYERFTECLTQILSKCQPKFNASGQMVCRIEEEHLWECKQLGAHSPYVLLNTLIYFHTKYFMLKTPEDHMKLSFAHILKYWKKGQPGKGGQPARSVSLRYYSVSTAKKDGSAPTSTTKKGSKDGIPVYEVTENQDNPLRCPVKLYEFYLSKCPESIKNRSDIFYPVPERSCVPDSPVWYSTMPINLEVMTKMLTRILLVREIQEAHLHAQPIYV